MPSSSIFLINIKKIDFFLTTAELGRAVHATANEGLMTFSTFAKIKSVISDSIRMLLGPM